MTAHPLFLAGAGDLGGLRTMAEAAYAQRDVVLASVPLCYMEAITFTRLAATHGDPQDMRSLVFLCSEFAAFWRDHDNEGLANYWEATALNLAEAAATDGDMAMADMVAGAADTIPAAVFVEARRLREAVGASCQVH